MPREAQFGVFEIGMNHAGEITPLVQAGAPAYGGDHHRCRRRISQFFYVGRRHRRRQGRDLPRARAGRHPPCSTRDHDYLHILFGKAREANGRPTVVTLRGFDEAYDWRIDPVRAVRRRDAGPESKHEGRTFDLNLQVQGRHMTANAVAALAVRHLCGRRAQVALGALAKFGAPRGGGETMRLGPANKPLLLVDESYNANLASMAAALDVYARVKPRPAATKCWSWATCWSWARRARTSRIAQGRGD